MTSYRENWWTDLRWHVANQFVLWGLKMMPPGDCKAFLLDRVSEWVAESKRQWWMRAQREAKDKADV